LSRIRRGGRTAGRPNPRREIRMHLAILLQHRESRNIERRGAARTARSPSNPQGVLLRSAASCFLRSATGLCTIFGSCA
jgi:hypothetical protein